MMILLVAVFGVIVAAALAFWPSPAGERHPARQAPNGGRNTGPPPESLEGVLTGQLIRGDITRPQYRRALERIAVREERRHPLVVPWDESPGTRP